jgi:hypothetical protein
LRFVFVLLLVSQVLMGQQSAPGLHISCPASHHIFSDTETLRNLRVKSGTLRSARFTATYHDVPEHVKAVVQEAFAIWGDILISRVPIKTHIYWEELASSTLASAGSDKVYKNFPNAPQRDVWYPSALANAISGKSINDQNTDIILRINKNIFWAISSPTGPSGSGGYDLLSVILHEIAHGIGFVSSFEENGTTKVKWGIQNIPFIYDKYLVDTKNQELVNNRYYTNDSEELLKVVTGGDVHFKIAAGEYSNDYPLLHTPSPFSSGASLSHLSNSQFNLKDGRDRLMLPGLSSDRRYHYPGNGILAILYQIGWPLTNYDFEHNYPVSPDVNPITLFPNPASEYVILNLFGYTNETTFEVFDTCGRAVSTGKIESIETEIATQNLSAGKYIVRVGSYSAPFIKL